jgi:hypothetical protein
MALALGVVAAVCVGAAIEPWPVGVFQDDGVYAVLAKSLATGQGYRFIQMPGAPNATHYPPGYPLLLAALWKVSPSFPANVTLFKFANAALLGVVAAVTYRFARSRGQLSVGGAALTTLLFTSCTPLVLLSVMVLSEPLFMAILVSTLWLAERVAAGESRRPLLQGALAGAAIGVLALVRTLGVFVLPALLPVLAWRRQWRAAAATLASTVIVLLPWQLWVAAHQSEVPPVFLGKYGSYTGWLADAVRVEGLPWLIDVMRHNLGKLAFESWTHTGTVLAPMWVRVAATLGLLALLLPGTWAALRRLPVMALFVLGYTAVVVAWPFAPARFVWGIWPLLGIVLALGVAQWVDWGRAATAVFPRRALMLVPAAVAPLLLTGYARFNYQSTRERWWSQVQGSVALRARPMAEWVNAYTNPTDVLATDDDLLVYLYTGRRTIPNGMFTAQEHLVPQTPAFAVKSLRTILDTYDVQYVLAGTEYATYAVRGLLQQQPPRLRIVTGLSRGAVFAPLAAERGGGATP